MPDRLGRIKQLMHIPSSCIRYYVYFDVSSLLVAYFTQYVFNSYNNLHFRSVIIALYATTDFDYIVHGNSLPVWFFFKFNSVLGWK